MGRRPKIPRCIGKHEGLITSSVHFECRLSNVCKPSGRSCLPKLGQASTIWWCHLIGATARGTRAAARSGSLWALWYPMTVSYRIRRGQLSPHASVSAGGSSLAERLASGSRVPASIRQSLRFSTVRFDRPSAAAMRAWINPLRAQIAASERTATRGECQQTSLVLRTIMNRIFGLAAVAMEVQVCLQMEESS